MDQSKLLPGVYRAEVTETRDPQRRGRVAIKIPRVSGETQVWAPMLAHHLSDLVPAPGDEVIVAFEVGDFRSPIVLGKLWDGRM